jgi:hypothetical protein
MILQVLPESQHEVRGIATDLRFLCSLPCAPIWLPAAFPELHQSACLQNQVHPKRGLRTQTGGLVKLSSQEGE